MAHRFYTLEEYFNFFMILIQTDEDAEQAAINYREQFPNSARFPDARVFERLQVHMRWSGQLVPSSQHVGRTRQVDQQLEDLILAHFRDDPHLTIRKAARRLHTTYYAVQSTLRIHGWHAYHHRKFQDLRGLRDYAARLEFSRTLWAHLRANINFYRYILWTDEVSFTESGIHNSKNFVHWTDQGNPRVVRRAHFQHRYSINLWAGVINETLAIIKFIKNNFYEYFFEILCTKTS